MRRFRRPPLACREFVELVTDHLEGSLSRRDDRRFARHLAACGDCTRYLDQMRATLRLTGRLTVDDVPPEGRAALLEAFATYRRRD